MMNQTLIRWAGLLFCVVYSHSASTTTLSGGIEVGANLVDTNTSYQDSGTGILRFSDNGPELFQAWLKYDTALAKSLRLNVIANAYADGEHHLGLTQAFIQYKPLRPNQIKLKYRAGFFYPHWSVENTNEGWLSPYTYTQSAINSWIGEEVRIAGFEIAAFSNGRRLGSPWSWELNAGVFKGNDPTGTLLAWRGFSYHDRQSLHHDRVNFAPATSIVSEDIIDAPPWTDPFEEIDGRWGMYFGGHLNYQRSTLIKYYYYDNNADPAALNEVRLYAWDTKFHSLALSHNIASNLRLLSQIMYGSTDMGPRVVTANYHSAFVMLSYHQNKHRFSGRIEYSQVEEDNSDIVPVDQNDSKTHAFTAAWRYKMDKTLAFGIELHMNKNEADNRVQFTLPTQQSDIQARLVLGISF